MAKHEENGRATGEQRTADRTATTAEATDKKPPVYKNGRLTRYGMEQAIASGGSTSFNGVTITSVSQLPDESELASTPDEVQAALNTVDDQIAALQARKGKLTDAAKSSK